MSPFFSSHGCIFHLILPLDQNIHSGQSAAARTSLSSGCTCGANMNARASHTVSVTVSRKRCAVGRLRQPRQLRIKRIKSVVDHSDLRFG